MRVPAVKSLRWMQTTAFALGAISFMGAVNERTEMEGLIWSSLIGIGLWLLGYFIGVGADEIVRLRRECLVLRYVNEKLIRDGRKEV